MTEDTWSETLEPPFKADSIARGRLGHIYNTLDTTTGRMQAVECIDVVASAAACETNDSSRVCTLHQVLEAELQYCRAFTSDAHGRHVFCYDCLNCSQAQVYLRATSSVVKSLASLQNDFQRLHPLAIKQYVYQIVCGLHALHQAGLTCGGLSLSSVLLCGGNILKIAAWFPSARAMTALESQKILADSHFYRLSYKGHDEKAQDVRSVAFVMAEMLTGLRIRGRLMEKNRLLGKIDSGSPEWHFLSDVLALKPLSELLTHAYFSSTTPIRSSALDTKQEQWQGANLFIKEELHKCRLMERQHLDQIQAWQVQFEKKYRKKPESVDRPAGLLRLQGRLEALNERIERLNERLVASESGTHGMITAKETGTSDCALMQHEDHHVWHKPSIENTCDFSVGTDASCPASSAQSAGNRSPAQKAFLNRFHATQ